MKIAKRDIAIVMVVVALLSVFCAWKFSFSPARDTVDQEKSRQSELQSQIDAIKIRAKEAENMQKEMQKWQAEMAKELEPYHSNYLYEDGLMYLNNLEIQKENAAMPFEVLIDDYSVGESGVSQTINGQGIFTDKTYIAGTTTYSFNYTLTGYDKLKNFINYMVGESDKSGIKTLDTMTFDVNNELATFKGSINMTAYSIASMTKGELDNTYVPQNLEKVEKGITEKNIWGKFGNPEQAKENGENNE